jgi:hypothetical protein
LPVPRGAKASARQTGGSFKGPRSSVLTIFFHGAFRVGTRLLLPFLFLSGWPPGRAGQEKLEAP